MKWWKLNGVCFDSFLTKRPCRGHFVAYHIQCGHLGGSLPFFIIILISSGYWQKKPNSTASEKRTWGEKMRRPAAWLFDKRPNKFAGLLEFNKIFFSICQLDLVTNYCSSSWFSEWIHDRLKRQVEIECQFKCLVWKNGSGTNLLRAQHPS